MANYQQSKHYGYVSIGFFFLLAVYLLQDRFSLLDSIIVLVLASLYAFSTSKCIEEIIKQ